MAKEYEKIPGIYREALGMALAGVILDHSTTVIEHATGREMPALHRTAAVMGMWGVTRAGHAIGDAVTGSEPSSSTYEMVRDRFID